MENREIVKEYVMTKSVDFIRSQILSLELKSKAISGADKMQSLLDNFTGKLKKFIDEEKEIDRKWIPNVIELLGEDILSDMIDTIDKKVDFKKLSQDVFDATKSKNLL